jgi:threonine dehydratase
MVTAAGLVVEGAAATPIAALRAGRLAVGDGGGGGSLVLVVSGRNIAAARLAGLLGA